MTDKKQEPPQLASEEREARRQARRAKMTPQRRANAEARQAENAREKAVNANMQLEELRAAKAPAVSSRKGVLSRLISGKGSAEVQTLQSKIESLEEQLGTFENDLKKALKSLKKIEGRLDHAKIDPNRNRERASLALTEQAKERLAHFEGLKHADRLIELDFPIKPKVRYGWGKPSEQRLYKKIAAEQDRYLAAMASMRPFIETARKIQPTTDEPTEPHWINDWLPAFDAFSIYSYLAARNPATYLEIGSGTSTKFARRAIKDHGLRTKIISIDPHPRSEIDRICDKVIRSPLEEASLAPFSDLKPGDILFFDGSHRALQNSDVTVFFTEILPGLPKEILAGVHDIFLPDDYPPEWLARFYSEQYLLASWLLAGDALNIELPVWFCSKQPEVLSQLDELWKAPNLSGANIHGGIFWFTAAG